MGPAADIALVSLGTTAGLRAADAALADLIRGAGASCQVLPVPYGWLGGLRRHIAVVDLDESLAARLAARRAGARALVFSTSTTALLCDPPVPFAVRFDSPVTLNRPGPGGLWQRARERRAFARARLLLPCGEAAARTGAVVASGTPAVRVPIPIQELRGSARREPTAVAYAAYPRVRALELLCAAWARVGRPGARLLVGGCDRAKGRRRPRGPRGERARGEPRRDRGERDEQVAGVESAAELALDLAP